MSNIRLEPLFEKLKQSAIKWRNSGYPCKDYPLIGEILAFQYYEQEGDLDLKYLREPQFLALEIYWYVRLVLVTPHILDLYKNYFDDDKETFFKALGITLSSDALEFALEDDVLEKVKFNPEFVSKHRIQALHEALSLDYPSYILALAMGAGKTILIGTIICSEFAMSLRYPNGKFMKNALVFAPGTTIIQSLRELSSMQYERILPPDLSKIFLANLKIEFLDNNTREIQVQSGSSYNLIVTNTEKISLRAKRRDNQSEIDFEHNELLSNLRLEKIVSLPNLGIFSDEAHHTYGNNVFEKLKRVRETINYIHRHTPLIAVLNTTGTPYFRRQPLKEVIVWYGLGDGIKDNILKNLNHGIHEYSFGDQSDNEVFRDIVREFFKEYGNVSLSNGARAKIAFYFKTQEHLETSRSHIEQALVDIGENIDQILVNTQQSSTAEIDEFKRLNNPENMKRIILLIGKGVEGWNCPSLFACALIRKQTSNNYVLQAATRCLRQTLENSKSAKIFLDTENAKILDRELQNNFGIDLSILSGEKRDKITVPVRILKTDLPKLQITRTIKRAVLVETKISNIMLEKPEPKEPPEILRNVMTPDFSGLDQILIQTGTSVKLAPHSESKSCYTVAAKISSRYHLPTMPIFKKLNGIYPEGKLPNTHIYGLFSQIEKQIANYEEIEERVTQARAIIRIQDDNEKDIFDKDDDGVYVHHLRVIDQNYNLMVDKTHVSDVHDLSFHYIPYNFDSKPERSFFSQILSNLNMDPKDVKVFLFTGGLTDPRKTDFYFEYKGTDARYHLYFPDFVIVKKSGEFYIIEIKSDYAKGDETVERKQKAVERLAKIQPNEFKYQIIYCSTSTVSNSQLSSIVKFVNK